MNRIRFDDLARAVAKAGDGRTTRRSLLRLLGIGGAAGLAASAFGGSALAASQAAPATPAASPTAQPEESYRPPGGKTFQDIAFERAFDIESIFRFVADEVRYEPYGGILRGAKGTLWGLAGNSADKALLLAELLKEALVDFRFAVGQLDDAAATQILTATAIDAETARAHAEKVMAIPPPANGTADTSGLPPDQVEALERIPQAREELLTMAKERLAESVEMIDTALTDAGITLPEPATDLPELERTRHIWVQYASGTDWIDLDPTLPNAEAGTTLTSATQTVRELPPELYHTVDIRVVAETVAGGQPLRSDFATYQAKSPDLVGVPITVMFAKPQALEGLGISIVSAFTGAVQWLPYVITPGSLQRGTPLAFRSGAATEDLLGESEDVLGGGTSAEGDTLAAWLSVDVHAPDGQTHHTERTVFDRVDPAARAAGTIDVATIPPIELVNVPELGDVYLPMLSVTNLAVVGYQVPGSYFNQDFSIKDSRADLANVTHGHHFLRAGLEVDQASEIGYRFFPNEPNVTALSLVPTQVLESSDGRMTTTIDMFHQSYGATPLDGATAAANPAIISGALSHLTERALFGELVTIMPTPAGKAFLSVGRVFEEAKKAGIPLATLQPGTTPTGIDVSPQAEALIGEALAAGYVVIVPERGVPLGGMPRTGWWQINPQTGETFDRMENGGSSQLVEEEVTLGTILAELHHLHSLTQCIIGVVAAVAGIIALIAGSKDQGAVFVVALLPYTGASCLIAFVH
jgi:hypothetical protein